jgi:hypothetical protein
MDRGNPPNQYASGDAGVRTKNKIQKEIFSP